MNEPAAVERYTQVSLYRPAHVEPDDYMNSPTEMSLIHPGKPGIISGQAKRTGITRPGYANHPVYELRVGWSGAPLEACGSLWVYEAGRFVESNEWHRVNENRPMGGPWEAR